MTDQSPVKCTGKKLTWKQMNTEDRIRAAVLAERDRVKRIAWYACSKYGKVGEVVFITFKALLDKES